MAVGQAAQDYKCVEQLLVQPASNGQSIISNLAQAISSLQVLKDQDVATVAELNDKFVAQGGGALELGKRDIYDKGLAARIGPFDDRDPISTMHTKHNEEDYSSELCTAGKYGTKTSAAIEWKAAAGEWAKDFVLS